MGQKFFAVFCAILPLAPFLLRSIRFHLVLPAAGSIFYPNNEAANFFLFLFFIFLAD